MLALAQPTAGAPDRLTSKTPLPHPPPPKTGKAQGDGQPDCDTRRALRMSFWMVPVSLAAGTPCSSAATMNMAMMGKMAPFMVIDTDIRSKGMPSNRIFMSSTLSMATPAMPTSPDTRGWSES